LLLDSGDQLLLGGSITLTFSSSYKTQILEQNYPKSLNHEACFL